MDSSKCSGNDEFEQLRKFTRNGAEFFKEIISVLDERAELQLNYAKSLQKLSVKLTKAAQTAVGTVDTAWRLVSAQMENEAVIHRNLGLALEEEIIQPLKAVQNSQVKLRKAEESAIEKAVKRALNQRLVQEKAKKISHALAAECEKAAETVEKEQRKAAKAMTDKQLAKVENKRNKLFENNINAEKNYHDLTLAVERQRRSLKRELAIASSKLETLEEARLANLQTALGRYRCHLSQIGPALTSIFSQQFRANIEPILSADIRQDLARIFAACRVAHLTYDSVTLCDFYAEDFSNSMNSDRRKDALTRCSYMFEKDMEKARVGRLGLDSPNDYDNKREILTKNCFPETMTVVDFVDYHEQKIQCALDSLGKATFGSARSNPHYLSKFEQKQKDKQGLRQTTLRIPCGAPGPGSSEKPVERAVREDGDGQSPPRTHSERSSRGNTQQQQCQALYDFTSQQDDQLTIHAGDVIKITEKTTHDWWHGELLGQKGLFPASYVQQL